MTERRLPFPVFDADNHLYEPRDAFTKFLPTEYRDLIRLVDMDGKVRLVVKNRITSLVPNPTLERVMPPGFYSDPTLPRVIKSPPEFFEPGPRLAWMHESGIDRALLWPSLGLSIEERFGDDAMARHVVSHSFNQWLYEHWGFAYEDAIFAPPLISLAIVDEALRQLEWALERDARVIYVQPATAPAPDGRRRSIALREFDPFWKAVEEADVLVGMHAGDAGIQRYLNEFEGTPEQDTEYLKDFDRGTRAFSMFIGMYERPTADLIGSMVCHGMLTRFPRLRILPVEQGTAWVRPMISRLGKLYADMPALFEEDPLEVFARNITIHAFRDPDPVDLIGLVGVDRVVFGSDFPHPEGLADPLSFHEDIAGLPEADRAKVMGGNVARLLKMPVPA